MTMHFLTSKSEKLKTVLSTLTEAYKDGLQVKKEGNSAWKVLHEVTDSQTPSHGNGPEFRYIPSALNEHDVYYWKIFNINTISNLYTKIMLQK